MNVPGFLARQFYVKGSLRNTERGFSLQAHNQLGDAMLVGLGSISVDGAAVPPQTVSAMRDGDTQWISAVTVTPSNPIPVRRGDRVTIHIAGPRLAPGNHRLEVELVERGLGKVRVGLTERLAADSIPS